MSTCPDNHESPLLQVLRNRIIPAIARFGIDKLVVARASWQEMRSVNLPDGVNLEQRSMVSQRIRVHKQRLLGGDAAQVDAHWPQDHLYSRRVPMLGFTINGALSIPLGDYNLHCKEGHSFLILPGTAHSDGSHLLLDERFMNQGSREICYMIVRGNGVECWLSRVQNRRRILPRSTGESLYVPQPQARQYLESLTEEMGNPNANYRKEIGTALLTLLTTALIREIEESHALSTESSPKMPSDIPSVHDQTPIDRAKEYMQSHLYESPTIEQVAAHVYMSRAAFTRLFRAETGETFVQYLTKCRIAEAKVLLRETAWPIHKVADSVGLSHSHLRVTFHKFERITPSQYRERAQNPK